MRVEVEQKTVEFPQLQVSGFVQFLDKVAVVPMCLESLSSCPHTTIQPHTHIHHHKGSIRLHAFVGDF